MSMFVLHVDEGSGSRMIPFNDSSVAIGRGSANEIVIQDPKASREHCVLEPRAGSVYLRDLASRNGTWLKGKRVTGVELSSGDEFRIGRVRFRLTQTEPNVGSATEKQASGVKEATVGRRRTSATDQEPPDVVLQPIDIELSLPHVKERVDANLTKKSHDPQRLIKIVALVACLALIIGGIGWLVHQRAEGQRRQLAQQKEESARKEKQRSQRSERTTRKVEQLIAGHQFLEAEAALQGPEVKGLSADVHARLQDSIKRGASDWRTKLQDQAETLIQKYSMEEARTLLKQAGELDRFAGGGSGERQMQLERVLELAPSRKKLAESREADGDGDLKAALAALEEAKKLRNEPSEVSDWEDNLCTRWAKKLMKESRESAAKENWDGWQQAVEAYQLAMILPSHREEVEDWGTELGERVGGRVKIDVQPNDAHIRVQVDGRKCPTPRKIKGLTSTQHELKITADGFEPEHLSVQVNFPSIKRIPIVLNAELPKPLWVVRVLAKERAQSLAIEYYRRKNRNARWRPALDRLKAVPAQPPKAFKTSSEADRDTLQKDEVKHYKVDDRDEPLSRLNRLAEFTSAFYGRVGAVIEKCGNKIGRDLKTFEDACANCHGSGINPSPCPHCHGKKRSKEMRPCADCAGTGEKNCPVCHGKGKIKCRTCGGRGWIRKSVPTGGPFLGERKVTCPTCHGCGKETCPNKYCKGTGKITCTLCGGHRKRKQTVQCPVCHGKGGFACGVCGGKGQRSKMDSVERTKIEQDIRAAMSLSGS